ncbi:MAG: type II secretion system GspH family protein, partial [Candidatus Roizmanbacteria bacterium]|nr:type II secretion system GspH family protein [Candidatus Roizmanbacteria bacterium]
MNTQKRDSGFTLMEIMITFIIMIVLASIFPLANYMGRLQFITDTKKKADLKELRNVLEVFYRQKERYPSLDELGYWNNGVIAYVCGDKYIDSSVRSFASVIPCSPADDTGNPYVYFPYNNQQDFVFFVNLDDREDAAIESVGCSGGCSYFTSPTDLSSTFYNYAVYSSIDYMRS